MGKTRATNPQPIDGAPAPAVRHAAREVWARIKAHPVRNLSILSLMAASVVGLSVALMHLTPKEVLGPPVTELVANALAALDAGDYPLARDRAADLRLRTDIPKEQLGIPAYILGVVMYNESLDEWQDRERRAYFLMAARYLDEARRTGFPAGREGQASFLLGKSLNGCGRLGESVPPLLVALEHHPQEETEICRLLTEGYLEPRTRDLKKAAQFNERYLKDEGLNRNARDAALLVQARITFELGEYEQCREQLKPFQPDSIGYSEALLLQGRLQFVEGSQLAADPARKSEAFDRFGQARELFARAFDLAGRNGLIMRQSQYLQGLCLRQLGDFLGAEALFARNRRSYLDTPEGMASGIEEAELQLLLGNDSESLNAYRRVLRQIADTADHALPWISDDDLRHRLELVVADFRQEPQFEAAADLLQAISWVFPDSRTVESQATLHQDWAEHLAAQSAAPDSKNSVVLRTQSRLEHRQAGVDFGRLAKLRYSTRHYPNDLWRSAENYLRGQDYESAAEVYRRHLENQTRNGRPPALTRLGECLLALNRPEEALQYVSECIESFPKDPFVYRARLIAAEAGLEMGRDQQAKELLTANLENESLTPQSREWRDSLFALGRIHFLDGCSHETASRQKGIDSEDPIESKQGLKELELAHASFREAIGRLSEAVQREPNADLSIESRYMLASAHAHSAKLPRKQLAGVHVETTRVALRRELQRELNAAIEQFDGLKNILIGRQEFGDLSPVQNRILRNCFFGKADALFELEQYEDAIAAYSSATNRFQQEPEALEAFMQIAICQRKLSRLGDSRRTLEQARLVLARIPETASFKATTRYDRKEWTDLLGWLSSL